MRDKEKYPPDGRKRCDWPFTNPLLLEYHDREWGVPLHDDVKLFEFFVLEGAQAGLSWITILNRRENYRKAFDNFDFNKIAYYDRGKIDELVNNEGIIRNRLKIQSAVTNALSLLKVRDEFGSFDAYTWSFVNGKPIKNSWKDNSHIPVTTKESDAMSKDLKKRGFRFAGSTICYAHMQATGMVNDHLASCFRNREI